MRLDAPRVEARHGVTAGARAVANIAMCVEGERRTLLVNPRALMRLRRC